MKTFFLTAGLLVLSVSPGFAQAPARTQTQTYALIYTLRTSDLRAQKFVQSVKTLQEISDDAVAGARVRELSLDAVRLRRRQAAAYTQIAWLLDQMDAPAPLRHWSAQTAKSLSAPLLYSGEAQSLAKTEPDTARTLAELWEVQTVKTNADAQRPSLTAWLKLSGGRLSLWTAEVGAYAADLTAAGQSPTDTSLSSGLARRLLQTAPPETPSEVRGDLSEMVPKGGGNLQNLATISLADASPQKRRQVSGKLTAAYQAEKLIDALDKTE